MGLGEAARRAYQTLTRATIVSANDKPKMQELTIRPSIGRQITHVEHWQPYGETIVPLPPDKDGEAEAILAYLGGSSSHPVVLGVADRRHRPKDLKPGDRAWHDHRGQITKFTEGGISHQSPLTIRHDTLDKDGKVTSSVVQDPSGKVTFSNKDGATMVMDGPNITTKPGAGGTHTMDGNVAVKGSLTATKTVAGQSVTSGGLGVLTA